MLHARPIPQPVGTFDLVVLIEAIVLKRRIALGSFYDATASRIYGTAYRVLGSSQDAEEIVSDVLMYIWGHAQEYCQERGSVMAWVTVITRHRAIDRIRKRQQNLSINDEKSTEWIEAVIADHKGPEEVLGQFQERIAVHAALASLPPLRRKLMDLSFFQNLSHREIADRLAMPQGTVKSHVRRGIIAMRTAMML